MTLSSDASAGLLYLLPVAGPRLFGAASLISLTLTQTFRFWFESAQSLSMVLAGRNACILCWMQVSSLCHLEPPSILKRRHHQLVQGPCGAQYRFQLRVLCPCCSSSFHISGCIYWSPSLADATETMKYALHVHDARDAMVSQNSWD